MLQQMVAIDTTGNKVCP